MQTLRRFIREMPVLCAMVLVSACIGALPVIATTLEQINATSTQSMCCKTLTTSTLTAPAISAPVLSGTATGTYTLAGTPTITAPSISSPVLSGTATGTYTFSGTPTYGTGTMTGGFAGDFTLASSHACGTNFVRTTPNFCYRILPPAVAYTPANSCTGHVVDANIPTNKLAWIEVHWRTKANNGAGARLGSTTFSGASASCAVILATSVFSVYEQTAVAAATVLAEGSDMILATTSAGTLYATDLNNGGNGTSEIVSTTVWGYFE